MLTTLLPDGQPAKAQLAVAVAASGMTLSYMMNKMGPGILGSERTEMYLRAVYGALEVPLPELATAAPAASG